MSNKYVKEGLLNRDQQLAIKNSISNMFIDKAKAFFNIVSDGSDNEQNLRMSINSNANYQIKLSDETIERMRKDKLHFMNDAGPGKFRGALVDNKNNIKGRAIYTIEKIEQEHAAAKGDGEVMNKQIYHQFGKIQGQLAQIQMQNLAIMKQLMQMSEVINDVRNRVIELQEMHDNDLIGGIVGMRDQLLQIRHVKDSELMKNLMANAITRLNADRGSIEREIVALLDAIPMTPSGAISTYLKIAKDEHFCDDVTEKYGRIEKLFNMYLLATLLMGYGYAYTNEQGAYLAVFTPNRDLVENENFQKLINAERLLEGDFSETWYKNPEEYLVKIGREAKRLFSSNNRDVEIQITGAELLEVLVDADEGAISEIKETIQDISEHL